MSTRRASRKESSRPRTGIFQTDVATINIEENYYRIPRAPDQPSREPPKTTSPPWSSGAPRTARSPRGCKSHPGNGRLAR